MANNRARVENICIKRMREWDKSGINADMYQELFKQMSDKDFARFMDGLRDGTAPLSGTIPNFSDVKVSITNNVKMASDLGYEMYKHLWIRDPQTGQRYLTPNKHLVYETNVCRQIQILEHKISVPVDNNSVDARTGQATGDSGKARCSGPEMMMLKSRGLNHTILEMMKFRGGDNTSMRYLDDAIIREGSASMASVPGQSERSAKSVRTLSAILFSMMFTNNL